MWRKGNRDQVNKNKLNNNRLRVVVAVVFLLSGALLYKLFSIQIKQFDLYTAMASSQHRIYSEIKAERGKIFFGEKNNNKEKLYPLATNKDFADLYVVPKDIASSTEVAEKLYKYFDEPILLEELKKEIASGSDLIISTSTKEEIIQKF
jgi:cell division protein FtsI/penicillin-binding protein 2